ncbi:5'-3' exonuclease [Metamycoplasma hominis]|uniref:5'-3' exonuclease n=1 Tax=Metamycoplasma hominis TaxID=2098 RepID=UPI003CF24CAB
MKKDNEQLLIIDGTFLAYRSYYATSYNATQILTTSEGFETNAIVAFFKTLFLLLKKLNPKYIYIAFDSHVKTFRHELFPSYKDGRKKAPESFYLQLDLIQEILTNINIQNQYYNGFEADDIIAKVKNKFNLNTIIFSGDQDLNQLIDEQTAIIKKDKTGSFFFLNSKNFSEYYDFLPNQVVDYKALVGDNSDNFKGVVGIGSKSAKTLLEDYKTIENIYNNIEKIKPSIAKKLMEYKENTFLDKYLATLRIDFDLQLPELGNLAISNIAISNSAKQIIDKFELYSLENSLKNLINKK